MFTGLYLRYIVAFHVLYLYAAYWRNKGRHYEAFELILVPVN